MTKPQNILSEVARVREIMGLQNITEQNNAQIGKTVVIHSGKDEDPIQIIIDRAAKYDVLDDAAENVAGPFIDEVIAKFRLSRIRRYRISNCRYWWCYR